MPRNLVFSPIPYTRAEVPLGSLVSNVLRPHKGLTTVIPESPDDYTTREYGAFDGVLKSEVANSFFAQITRMLHLERDTSHDVSLHVKSKLGREYELKEPEVMWKNMLTEEETKEKALNVLRAAVKGRDVWFVTALKTFLDAVVEVENGKGSAWTIKANVPAGEIAKAASGIQAGDVGDVGGGVTRTWKSGANETYEANGERIFAIEFRKVVVRRCEQGVLGSIPEKGIIIKTHADFRGGWKEGSRAGGEETYVAGLETESETLEGYNDELEELDPGAVHVIRDVEGGNTYIVPRWVDYEEEY